MDLILVLRSRSIPAIALATLCLGLTGCPEQPPADPQHYPLQADTIAARDEAIKKAKNAKERADIEASFAKIESALANYYGSPESPKLPGFSPVSGNFGADAQHPLDRARAQYRRHCMHCHGYYGAGDGPTAPFLLPKPRNFLYGEVKFTSTKAGEKPLHDDLKRTIAQGVQGTMMPAFGPIQLTPDLEKIGLASGFAGPPDFDVDAMAWYVQLLAMRGELERKIVAVWGDQSDFSPDDVAGLEAGIEGAWKGADQAVLAPGTARPERTPDMIAKSVKAGDDIFHTPKGDCVRCHGVNGLGDGLDPNAPGAAIDIWKTPLRPANLTLGVYRGGRRPIDLYRRISAGIKGNVMPEFGKQLSPEEVWNLVDYIQSLGLRQEIEAKE